MRHKHNTHPPRRRSSATFLLETAPRERALPGFVGDLPCPECAVYMALVPNPYKGAEAVYYRCPEVGCSGSHGAHADGEPLGIPATQPTKDARMAAHRAFDAWWRAMGMRRSDAYRWLALKLQVELEHCHIGRFDVETCRRVVAAVASVPAAGSGSDARANNAQTLDAPGSGRQRGGPAPSSSSSTSSRR